ncbi:MAG: XRE family transcriptional regulator [Proteobacteria bacterium]|nr:XRE family transcriptional regulator [Pseudomonadota bacterium]
MNTYESVQKRTYLGYATDAALLLGKQIEMARFRRGMSRDDLAERAGISTDTLREIEKGGMTVAVGLVFEVAALVGVCLFEPDKRVLALQIELARCKLCLISKDIKGDGEVDDNF